MLLDKEEEAEAFFNSQASVIDEFAGIANTGKTVAFFYIASDGSVNVRASSDYVPVSYTHLDVYKRQSCAWSWTVSRRRVFADSPLRNEVGYSVFKMRCKAIDSDCWVFFLSLIHISCFAC